MFVEGYRNAASILCALRNFSKGKLKIETRKIIHFFAR